MNIIEKRRRKAWAHATMVIMNKVIREASTGTIFIYGETLYGKDYFLTPDDALDAVLVTMGVLRKLWERDGVSGEINEDDYYTLMVSDGDGGYGKRRYKVDEVKLIFDSTEEDARVEEVDVVRNYDVTRSPFFAFDMKGECREVEHQTRIHVPEGSWGEYQFNVN